MNTDSIQMAMSDCPPVPPHDLLRIEVRSKQRDYIDKLHQDLAGQASIIWDEQAAAPDIVIVEPDKAASLDWMQCNAERDNPIPVILYIAQGHRGELLRYANMRSIVAIVSRSEPVSALSSICRRVISELQTKRRETQLTLALIDLVSQIDESQLYGTMRFSKLTDLLDDLKAMRSGVFFFSPRLESAARLIHHLREHAKAVEQGKNLLVSTRHARGSVYCDVPLLQRCLSLMVDWAASMTDQGGHIEVSIAERSGRSEVKITTLRRPHFPFGLDSLAETFLLAAARYHNGRFAIHQTGGGVVQSLILPCQEAVLEADRRARASSSLAMRSRHS